MFQLLHFSIVILIVLKVKTSNFKLFGSAFQNQFSSEKTILVEATIPFEFIIINSSLKFIF